MQLIASISKTFTGVALMKAVEEGHLNLDDDINDHLPFELRNPHFPDQVINLRHLASHTSGLNDPDSYRHSYVFTSPLREELFPEAWHELLPGYDGNEPMPLGDFLQRLASAEDSWYSSDFFLPNTAGSVYEYSNTGAALLGYVIEQATGEDLRIYSQRHILTPLGMSNSTWHLEEVNADLHTVYYLENQQVVPPYHIVTYPDGGLYSSVADLTKYLQAMIKGYQGGASLLTAASFQEMMRPQFAGEDLPDGICWDLEVPCCIGHGGNDFGTSTLMYFDRENGIGRILFANISIETEELEEGFYGAFNTLFAYDLSKESGQ